jgi:hypothetical protein
MQVGIVRVTVHQALVAVRMAVRLAAVPGEVMFVLMVLIMHVDMSVLDRLVDVPVLVPLGDMEPTPSAISVAATQNSAVVCSPSTARATAAPKKGATEK